MKKISILSLHLGYGGIEKSIVALVNLLCEKYKVEIACSYKLYEKSVFPIDKRVKVKYLTNDIRPNRESFKEAVKNKKIVDTIKEANYAAKVLRLRKRTMVNYIKKCDADIIISTRDIFDEWLGDNARDGVIKIGWEHNHYHDNLKYADTVTRSCKKLDYLVLVSKALRDYYSARLSKYGCTCVYIPNIIDKMPKYIAPLEAKRLISVGRLSKEKGQLDLLKIYKSLHEKYPSWTLDIIGDGVDREKLEDYIKENNLTKSVKLHGYQDKDYIDKMLHDSSIYLMTSYTESFGIVLIEAMSHGVPCIAFSSAEGARELINSGENGYLIKNRNFEMFEKKIIDLIEDKEGRKNIGKVARNGVKKYTGEVVKNDWFNLLENGDLNE